MAENRDIIETPLQIKSGLPKSELYIILTPKDVKEKPVNMYDILLPSQINKAEFIAYVENNEVLILKSKYSGE